MKKILLTLGIFLGFDSQAMDFQLPREGSFVTRELMHQVVINAASSEEDGTPDSRTITTYGAMRVMNNSRMQTTTTFQQTVIQDNFGRETTSQINEINQCIPTLDPPLMNGSSPVTVNFTPPPLSTVHSGLHNRTGSVGSPILGRLAKSHLNKTQVISGTDDEQENSETPVIVGRGKALSVGDNTNSENPVVSRAAASIGAQSNAPALEDFINVPLEVLEKKRMMWYYIYNSLRVGQVCINGLEMLLSGITSYVLLNGTAEGEEGPTVNRSVSGGICATSAVVNIVSAEPHGF